MSCTNELIFFNWVAENLTGNAIQQNAQNYLHVSLISDYKEPKKFLYFID